MTSPKTGTAVRLLTTAISLLITAGAAADDGERNMYYVVVSKDGQAKDWELFEAKTPDWRKKLEAVQARLKQKHGVEQTQQRVLLRDECGALYVTSDAPGSYNLARAPDRKELINKVAALQHSHRASRKYEIDVLDMRCNGDAVPQLKLGRPWATWKLATKPKKISEDESEIVAYLWNPAGELKTWVGTLPRWSEVASEESRKMSEQLGLPNVQNAVVLSRGQCELQLDAAGQAFANPGTQGLFSARVKARELSDQGTPVKWLMCSDTNDGKAVVERW
ncbi:MAG TPA: hypothetical protein VK524_14990 [Polyangiaceae bacterium]|nr:hypothetical protein [Polyangiaceae bacterium]